MPAEGVAEMTRATESAGTCCLWCLVRVDAGAGKCDNRNMKIQQVLMCLGAMAFVGDVVAGHGDTPLIRAAKAAGCRTATGGHMVEAVQELMADFMLGI